MQEQFHQVFISIGSNIKPQTHLTGCLDRLYASVSHLRLSSVYQSDAVGFDGEPFLNLVAGFQSPLAIGALQSFLRNVETEQGRDRGAPRFSDRTLDLDILMVDCFTGLHEGIILPRAEITENAYVLAPLSELAGNRPLPGRDTLIHDIWRTYDKARQPIKQVEFRWRGRLLPVNMASHGESDL